MSSSRLRICACTDTSSAETGSSQMISFGLEHERAGDRDALALAAGELVRPAVARRRRGRGRRSSSTSSTLRLALGLGRRRFQMSSGSATMSPTLRRGFSDEIGSWKIICMLGAEPRAGRSPVQRR